MSELQSLLAEHYRIPVSLLHLGWTGNGPSRRIYFGFTTRKNPPFLVIHESLSSEFGQRIQREYEARAAIYPNLPQSLQETIPWAEILRGPDPILIEPYLAGQELPYPKDAKAFRRYLELVTTWIQAFQAATGPTEGDLIGDAHALIESLQERLPRHRRWLSDLEANLEFLSPLSPCLIHGDYWRGNLILQRGGLRVIDWEFIQRGGNPWFDILLNLTSLACEGRDPQGIFERCFLRESPYSREIGRWVKGPRKAIALSVILVVLELVSRDLSNGLNIEERSHYAIMRRLMFEKDQLDAIQKALWTNRPDLLAKVT